MKRKTVTNLNIRIRQIDNVYVIEAEVQKIHWWTYPLFWLFPPFGVWLSGIKSETQWRLVRRGEGMSPCFGPYEFGYVPIHKTQQAAELFVRQLQYDEKKQEIIKKIESLT